MKPVGFHNPYLAAISGCWMHRPETSADVALRAAGRHARRHHLPLTWLMQLSLSVSSATAWHRVIVQLLNMAAIARRKGDYGMARIYVHAARKANRENSPTQ